MIDHATDPWGIDVSQSIHQPSNVQNMICDYSKYKYFADRAGGGEGREVAAEPAARHGGRGGGHQGGAGQGGQCALC